MKQAVFNEKAFWEMPLVVIMRGFPLETVAPIVQAIHRGGLRMVEITMNTQGAEEQIQEAIQASVGTRMQIGAGTVTTPSRWESAIKAGANYVVTPNLNIDIIHRCQEARVPFIPGAMTPTEIYQACEWGALAAKIFPANTLGPSFIKAIKAPMPNLRVAPTGGVTVERMQAYLEAGADAFGLGSPLFPSADVEARNWDAVEQAACSFHDTYMRFQQGQNTD
jgi:2-dehydro-3-deoxyphosphogluconate aldolase / (4S)-4-hydroxy-2-oxoglutarate aldolase